jgi:hypothetical protein
LPFVALLPFLCRSSVTGSRMNDEARTIVSQSHRHSSSGYGGFGGGGGGGGTAASSGGAGGMRGGFGVNGPGGAVGGGGGDSWAVDLRDLDEALESSLPDPSTAGSLYIRLLVRTVGVLECEEDVERMVLEGIVDRFRASNVRAVREAAGSKLHKELGQRRNALRSGRAGDEEEDELSVHTRLFTGFIGLLLDASLLSLRRMVYLVKLLYVSRTQRAMDQAAGAVVSSVTGHSSIDTPAVAVDMERCIKEQSKKQVLLAWMGIEELVVQQMLSHLVEPDVQDIVDMTANAIKRMEYNSAGDRGGAGGGGGRGGGDGFLQLEKGDDDDENNGEVTLIFTPSARHAAPIFKRIVTYSNVISKITKDNSLEDMRLSILTAKQQLNKTATGINGKSALDVIQSFLESELIPVIQSTVNHGMREIQMNNQHFSVNIGDSGNSNEHGNINNGGNRSGGAGTSASASGMGAGGSGGSGSDTVPLCYAAKLCCSSSKPLFSYWLQLHQHRNMVCTVLDRLIRGFASAAREEFEGLTFGCLTVTQEMHGTLINSTKMDPLFKTYRTKVYGAGKVTVDDLFQSGKSGVPSAAPGSGSGSGLGDASRAGIGASAGLGIGGGGASGVRRSFANNNHAGTTGLGLGLGLGNTRRGSGTSAVGDVKASAFEANELDDQKGRNALEITLWDELDYWDVGSNNYALTSQKVRMVTKDGVVSDGCLVRNLMFSSYFVPVDTPMHISKQVLKDFTAVATIASISYGCDWLVKRIST